MTGEQSGEMTVELLYWAGCPSADAALAMLEKELALRGSTRGIRLVPIVTMDDAVREGFPGSPTIRINTRDLVPERGPPALGCRVYRLRDGRLSALPDINDLRDALEAASDS